MADPVVTPAAAPAPGTPEHDAAMAAKVDASAAAAAANAVGAPAAPAAAPATERPAWLPEKFKSAEDMVASYKALEAKLGTTPAPAAAAPAVATPVKAGAALEVPAPEAAAAAVANAGLDMGALQSEWQTNGGDLKPETYASLEKAGIPKAMVEGYVAGQKALAADYDSSAYATAGGQEKSEAKRA